MFVCWTSESGTGVHAMIYICMCPRCDPPFGCDGGPWCEMGLQQCGGQAGTLSHFGYVHIRSRSMAPPDECHFLRSNTQTWKKQEVRQSEQKATSCFSKSHVRSLTGAGRMCVSLLISSLGGLL